MSIRTTPTRPPSQPGSTASSAELPTPAIFSGNAWEGREVELVPTSMHRAIDLFAKNKMARAAFGDDVYEHLLAFAQAELTSFDSHTVTDWETRRYYERV